MSLCSRPNCLSISCSSPIRLLSPTTMCSPSTAVACLALTAVSGFRMRSLVVARTLLLSTPKPVAQLPCESASTTSTLCPRRANWAAILITVVVLPTPPFWLITVTTLALPSGVGNPGGRSRGGRARAVLISSTASSIGAVVSSSTSVNSASITSGAFCTSGRSSPSSSAFIRAPLALVVLLNMPLSGPRDESV